MPTTYHTADGETLLFALRVMEKYHGPLYSIECTLEILMAKPPVNDAGDPTGPALKHHGTSAYALIRSTRPDERALGHADIHIKLDADFWEESSEEIRAALIDHELSHLIPKLDKRTGNAQRDDTDRPIFSTVNHDYEVGWFYSVARRHGRASIECKQLEKLLKSDAYRDCFQKAVQS